MTDDVLGTIYLPNYVLRSISFARRPIKRNILREIGIYIASIQKPIYDGLRLLRYDTVWASVTHNERVDAGAAYQSQQVFAGGASPAVPSATVYFNAIAIANATLTKTKTDQSLGAASSGVTTNEFTTLGLTRVTATSPIGGDYTAPASLGAQFTQLVKKSFTASGNATAKGAGLFNSTTVVGSILYGEDNFSSDGVLQNTDVLNVTISIAN